MSPKVTIDKNLIAQLCRRYHVRKLALFGSVLRDDFRPDSDVDVLVEFDADAEMDLMDLVEIREELQGIFGREVDLVEKDAIRNPFRRHAILTSHEVLYAA